MAADKLVDSTQLNSDLTSVANAIRTKGGTSGSLAFPAGFVSAVQAIPTGITPTGTKSISITANGTTTEDVTNYASAEISVNVQGGGGYTAEDWLDVSKPVGDIVCTASFNRYGAQSLLLKRTNINNVRFTNSTYVSDNCFQSSGIKIFVGEKVTAVCTSAFQAATSLTAVDVLGLDNYSRAFSGCTSLDTLILRSTSITAINTNTLDNTPFKNGGSGGTIYIPKSLYDHLGDGSASDYKAATNWSTWDSYGTITWAKIEGSIYETQYADGTPISG